MWLFIQPNDTLFFRDGRPFDAGADVWTGTIFPPYPATIYGMLRTFFINMVSTNIDHADYFANIPDEYKGLLGKKDEYGSLSLVGPFFGKKDNNKASLWIPCPSDLWKWKENDKTKYYLLCPDSNKNDVSQCTDLDIPFRPLSFPAGINSSELERGEGSIGGNTMDYYLIGNPDDVEEINAEKFWDSEHSTIIERDDGRLSAKEHQLAYPVHTRLQDDLSFEEKGFLIKIQGLNSSQMEAIGKRLDKPEAVRLGGECRIAIIDKVNTDQFYQAGVVQQITSTGRFRVILTSSAYFPQNAFYPDFLVQSDRKVPEGQWVLEGIEKTVTLISIVMNDRPARIGGWDLANKRPKAMIKAVPAGSVYFFEISNFDKVRDNDWVVKLVNASLPGVLLGGENDYMKQGFNTYLIGGWDYVSG